jgi:protein O-mannosyl-transferase
MNRSWSENAWAWFLFATCSLLTFAIYMAGVGGGFLFDDFPNIVDNPGVKPADSSLASLIRSALSSPSSEFKRPLSSLTFAINYLATGSSPEAMKITNVVIHLVNGWLVFVLCRQILRSLRGASLNPDRVLVVAALVAGSWLLLPINLTAVLYVVQRMESLANIFVLTGLIGYMLARQRMQLSTAGRWPALAASSVLGCTLVGLTAKETAVMLPMYAFVAEACVFRFRSLRAATGARILDKRLVIGYTVALALPAVAGLAWLLPGLLNPGGWSTRNFTMGTRVLTELRVVTAYVVWTLVPTPGALSFYHDDWTVSSGLLTPWTTLAGALALTAMGFLAWFSRRRHPSVTLGLALYASAHLLTGTILPLELVYEHRNYFASMGIMLATVPLLAADREGTYSLPLPILRYVALAVFFLQSCALLYVTSRAWNAPLSLAMELAARAPDSPRAQYELGRTYIILSRYDPRSPFTPRVYEPLERAMALPGSSILPEQALIFFHSRMHLPLKGVWWDSMISKLAANKVTVQDESSLGALSQCMQSNLCDLPADRMTAAFLSALGHEARSARLLAMYSDFAWNSLDDKPLGLRMAREAVRAKPNEPAYHVSVARMLLALGETEEAKKERDILSGMNIGGALDGDIASLDRLIGK